MKKEISFYKFQQNRKNFIKRNCNESFVIQKGTIPVIISAPHGVSQVRLGKHKFEEPGSLAFALELAKGTGAHLIAKTKNCDDDANFDKVCPYKEALKEYIKQNNIKYLIDVHGLAKNRPMDINLGTYLGKNIEKNEKLFDFLLDKLKKCGFIVSVDEPFWAGNGGSIAGEMSKLGIWTIQLEINCKYTNLPQNFLELHKILNILVETVENCENF